MADGLLFVYTDPGPVPAAEFNDWYDNEHGPARLTVPGITSGLRFHALDDASPPWLAYYEFRQGTLDSPEYRALAGQRVRAGKIEVHVVAGDARPPGVRADQRQLGAQRR